MPAQPAQPVPGGFRPALPLRVAFGGAAFKRVTVKDVNGVKDIDAEEADRKIKIHDDPAKGIEMEITEKKDGKDVIQKYEAKNAEELKTKHPEMHKLYEQYAKGPAGGIRIEAFAGGFPGIPGRVLPPGIPAPPVPAFPAPILLPAKLRTGETEKQLAERLDAALKEVTESLEQFGKIADKSDELSRTKEKLEAARKRLEELKAKLAE
jgi:hypothetical protein